MNKQQKCLDFIAQMEILASVRPGMLGPINEIVAMFYVADNIKNLLLFDEVLPQELSWNEFLMEKKLIRDLHPIPIEDNWDLERFSDLRRQYLMWVDERRASGDQRSC
jgi:hypothetical protein